MCIIVYKNKKAKMPTNKILTECFNTNSDGAGFALQRNGDNKILIRKGFMKLKSLKKALKEANIKSNDKLIVHFRIGTSGGIKQGLTHPFPATQDVAKLTALRVRTTGITVAHNGVIFTPEDKNLSDTALFVKEIVANKYIMDNIFKKQNNKKANK